MQMDKWDEVRAEEFCSFVTDGTHDSPRPQSAGKRLITSKHLKEFRLDFDSANYISENDYQKIVKRSSVEQWDILFSMIGTIGNIYLEKNKNINYACKNVGIFKFSGNKDNAYWMYYYLKSPMAKAYINSRLRGSTQSYIPLESLRDFPVLVPDEYSKRKIINILKSLDDKIELNLKINDNLAKQAMLVYEQMLGTTSLSKCRLCDIASITMGQSPAGSSYNEEGMGTVFYQGRTDFGFRFPTRRLYTTEPKKMAAKNDVLLSVRAPVGDINVANESCCIGRGLSCLRSLHNTPSFLYYTMASLRSQLDQFNGEGTVFGSISQDALNNLSVQIPSPEQIYSFETKVAPMDAMVMNNNEEILSLTALRDYLLPKLLNGQISIGG